MTEPARLRWRPTAAMRVCVTLLCGALLLLGSGELGAVWTNGSLGALGEAGGLLAMMVGVSVAMLRYAYGAQIVLADDHLLVRNTFARHTIALADIRRIDPGPSGIVLELADGTRIIASAVQQSRVAGACDWNTRAGRIVDTIMDRQRRRQAAVHDR